MKKCSKDDGIYEPQRHRPVPRRGPAIKFRTDYSRAKVKNYVFLAINKIIIQHEKRREPVHAVFSDVCFVVLQY